mgnify:CR=1 FL=1
MNLPLGNSIDLTDLLLGLCWSLNDTNEKNQTLLYNIWQKGTLAAFISEKTAFVVFELNNLYVEVLLVRGAMTLYKINHDIKGLS